MRNLIRRYCSAPDDSGTALNGILDAVSGVVVFWFFLTVAFYADAWVR